MPEKFMTRTTRIVPELLVQSRNNGTIWSQINGSISSNLTGYLIESKPTYELSKIYKEIFSSSTQSHVMELKLQLQTVKKEGLTIDDYVLKMKTLAWCYG